MRSQTLALLAVSTMSVFAAAGCSGSSTGQKVAVVNIDNSSARALCASINDAVQSHDYAAMGSAMDKDFRNQFRTILFAARSYVASLNALADTAQKKIGSEQADRFRKRADDIYASFMPSPVEGAIFDGKINWQVVGMIDETEGTRIIVGGRDTEFDRQYFIRQAKDGWYIVPKQKDIPAEQRIKSYAKEANYIDTTFHKYIKLTDDLRRKINSGEINAQNFEQKMSALRNAQAAQEK